MTPARIYARLPALQSRDFRLLWAGQTISVAGAQMQQAAILWHLHTLTGSAAALGLLGLSRLVAIAICSFAGGALADSRDRRRILLVTQTLMCVTAGVLGSLTASDRVTPIAVYIVTAAGAALASFANPARQALVPNLVPREHFANAVSLTSISHQIAGIVGPAVAGLLIGYGNLAWTYWANAASFLAVIGALLVIPPYPVARGDDSPPDRSVRAAFEGFRFVFGNPILAWTMMLDFAATFFSSASALLPIFAADILRVDARGYGALWAAESVGAMVAGTYMAVRPARARHGRTILIAVTVYGAATVVFGLSRSFALTWAALCVVGGSDTVSTILRHTIRQLITPDHVRGRMTAVNMIFVMGGPQLGNLEAGIVAQLTSAPFSVVTGGIGCVVAVAIVAARAPVLRRYSINLGRAERTMAGPAS
jgi:MFS family permease